MEGRSPRVLAITALQCCAEEFWKAGSFAEYHPKVSVPVRMPVCFHRTPCIRALAGKTRWTLGDRPFIGNSPEVLLPFAAFLKVPLVLYFTLVHIWPHRQRNAERVTSSVWFVLVVKICQRMEPWSEQAPYNCINKPSHLGPVWACSISSPGNLISDPGFILCTN